MIYRNKEHEAFYNDCISQQLCDCYHKAFFYVIGIDDNTRKNVNDIYDFSTGCLLIDAIHQPWQTSSSLQATRLAFNLYNFGTPTVDFSEPCEEQLAECRKYSVSSVFSSPYARYFWEAVCLLYHEDFEKPSCDYLIVKKKQSGYLDSLNSDSEKGKEVVDIHPEHKSYLDPLDDDIGL